MHQLGHNRLAATIPLAAYQAVPTLVWDERTDGTPRPTGATRSAKTPAAHQKAKASATLIAAYGRSLPNSSLRSPTGARAPSTP